MGGMHPDHAATAAGGSGGGGIAGYSDAIPMYNKNGRAFTPDERAVIAKRRGQCLRCGVRTHKVSVLRRQPLTNDDVYKGSCIRCQFPESVPRDVYEEWERRNKPAPAVKASAAAAFANTGSSRRTRRQVNSGAGGISNSTRSATSTSSSSAPSRNNPLSASAPAPLSPPRSPVPSPPQQQQQEEEAKEEEIITAEVAPAASLLASGRGAGGRNNAGSGTTSTSRSGSVRGEDAGQAAPEPPGHASQTPLSGSRHGSIQVSPASINRMSASTSHIPMDDDDPMSSSQRSIQYHHQQSYSRQRLAFRSVPNIELSPGSSVATSNLSSRSMQQNLSNLLPPSGGNALSASQRSITRSDHSERSSASALNRTVINENQWVHDYTGGVGVQQQRSDPMQVARQQDEIIGGLSTIERRKLMKRSHQIRNILDSEHAEQFLREVKPFFRRNGGDGAEGTCTTNIDDVRILIPLCGAIWRCCAVGSELVRRQVIDVGGMAFLLETLRKHCKSSSDIVELTLGALTSLIYDSVDRTSALFQAGGIESTIGALSKHPFAPDVLEWASRCIICFLDMGSNGSSVETSALVEKHLSVVDGRNGASLIFECLYNHVMSGGGDSSQQIRSRGPTTWSLIVLNMLCEHGDKHVRERTLCALGGDDGGMALLALRLLRDFVDSNGAQNGADALSTADMNLVLDLCCVVLESTKSNSSIHSSAADCVPMIVNVVSGLDYEDDDSLLFLESCYRFFWLMVAVGGEARDATRDRYVAEVIVDSIERAGTSHRGYNFLVSGACVLCRLSGTEDVPMNFSQVQKSIKVLVAALGSEEFTQDEQDKGHTLLTATFGLIHNVCGVPELYRPEDCRTMLQVIDRFLSAMSENHILQSNTMQVLSNLSLCFPEAVATAMIDFSILAPLAAALRDPSPNRKLEVCSILAAITTYSDDVRATLIASGALPSACAMLQESDDSDLLHLALDLLSALIEEKDRGTRQSYEIPPNTIRALVSLASSSRSPNTLQTKCFTALHAVVLSCETLQNISELVDFLTAHLNSDFCQASCGVIWTLAFRHPIREPSLLNKMFGATVDLLEMYYEGQQDSQPRGRRRPFVPETFTMAAGALAGTTKRILELEDPAVINRIDDACRVVVDVVYTALKHYSDGPTSLENLLDTIYCLCQINSDSVIQYGGMVAVVDAMGEYDGKASIQARGSAVLAHLSSSESLQVILSIVQTDGIDMLVRALVTFPDHFLIQKNACKALSHLSIDEESRMCIIAEGGPKLLLKAMKSNSECVPLLEYCCAAILNLMSDAGAEVFHGDEQVAEILVSAMIAHSSAIFLQEKALDVLFRITTKSYQLKDAIGRAGGVDAVLRVVEEFVAIPTVLERAFSTLWSLAALEHNRERIANVRGINAVINGMLASIEYGKVQKEGCGCIRTLAAAENEKSLIRQCGGVDAVVFAMWAHFESVDILVESCAALANLASPDEAIQENEVTAVVTSLERFRHSADLQANGCRVLLSYLPSPRNCSVMSSHAAQIKDVATSAASIFPDRCSHQAMQILSYLGL